MRTPKVYSLYNLIDWYNSKNSCLNIEKKELNTSPLNSTPWLSGFIEADGHFYLRTSISSKYPRVECKFELSQQEINHKGYNYFNCLSLIAKYLDTEVKKTKINSNNPQLRIRTTSLKGNII
jgi:hypothetical protein